MAKNYYEEVIEKIEQLIDENKNNEALRIIEEELSISYIPNQYEKKFIELKNKISPKSNDKKKTWFSRDELLILINEHQKHDTNFLLDISNGFDEYNWNGYEEEIEKIFNLKTLDNKVKSVIYNSLVVQKMNYYFKIDDFEINPLINKTIFETRFAQNNLISISKAEFKDPSILSIVEKIFFLYLMMLFPKCLFFEEKNIVEELYNVANVMIGHKTYQMLNEKEKEIFSIIKGQ